MGSGGTGRVSSRWQRNGRQHGRRNGAAGGVHAGACCGAPSRPRRAQASAHPPKVVEGLGAGDEGVDKQHHGASHRQVPPLVQAHRLPHQPAAADLRHPGRKEEEEGEADLDRGPSEGGVCVGGAGSRGGSCGGGSARGGGQRVAAALRVPSQHPCCCRLLLRRRKTPETALSAGWRHGLKPLEKAGQGPRQPKAGAKAEGARSGRKQVRPPFAHDVLRSRAVPPAEQKKEPAEGCWSCTRIPLAYFYLGSVWAVWRHRRRSDPASLPPRPQLTENPVQAPPPPLLPDPEHHDILQHRLSSAKAGKWRHDRPPGRKGGWKLAVALPQTRRRTALCSRPMSSGCGEWRAGSRARPCQRGGWGPCGLWPGSASTAVVFCRRFGSSCSRRAGADAAASRGFPAGPLVLKVSGTSPAAGGRSRALWSTLRNRGPWGTMSPAN